MRSPPKDLISGSRVLVAMAKLNLSVAMVLEYGFLIYVYKDTWPEVGQWGEATNSCLVVVNMRRRRVNQTESNQVGK